MKQKLEHCLIFIYPWFCFFSLLLCMRMCIWSRGWCNKHFTVHLLCFMSHQQSMNYRLKNNSVHWAGALSLFNHASSRIKLWPDVQNWREIEGEIWQTISAGVPRVLISWLVGNSQLIPCTTRTEVLTGRYAHYSVCPCGHFPMFYPAFNL